MAFPIQTWQVSIPAVAGAGMCAWAALHPRSQLFGATVVHTARGCALTFDDGPNPRVTPRLLALLEKHQVSATFFVLGKYVKANPRLAAEVSAAGHAIGNHTYGHRNLIFRSKRQIVEELQRCEDAIQSATGKHSSSVRPPYGFRGPQFNLAAYEAGYSKIVMWSVCGRDWNPQSWLKVSRRLQKTGVGDIVLLHDGDHRASNGDRLHMVQALEFWLPRWRDSGLQFVTMG